MYSRRFCPTRACWSVTKCHSIAKLNHLRIKSCANSVRTNRIRTSRTSAAKINQQIYPPANHIAAGPRTLCQPCVIPRVWRPYRTVARDFWRLCQVSTLDMAWRMRRKNHRGYSIMHWRDTWEISVIWHGIETELEMKARKVVYARRRCYWENL